MVYHFAFDLDFLGILEVPVMQGGWLVLARFVQFLFLGLVGVSVSLSSRGFLGQLKRGAFIFLLGMGVSLVTYVFVGEGYVKFGVLHFIGAAVPLLVLFKGRALWALMAAALSLQLGLIFEGLTTTSAFLFPFGITQSSFYSLDYFPLFPWLSVSLVGLLIGEKVYGARRETVMSHLERVPGLVVMGSHSLLIYLIHQPLFYGALLLFVSL